MDWCRLLIKSAGRNFSGVLRRSLLLDTFLWVPFFALPSPDFFSSYWYSGTGILLRENFCRCCCFGICETQVLERDVTSSRLFRPVRFDSLEHYTTMHC